MNTFTMPTIYRFSAIAGPLILFLLGCSTHRPAADVREKLLESSQKHDPTFPDEVNEKLTYFAHFGTAHTDDDPPRPIYLVEARSVLTGMPAPRGSRYIAFYDENFRFLGK